MVSSERMFLFTSSLVYDVIGDCERAHLQASAKSASLGNELRGVLTAFLERRRRQSALELLQSWYATPDEKGSEYWDNVERELATNRLSFREPERAS